MVTLTKENQKTKDTKPKIHTSLCKIGVFGPHYAGKSSLTLGFVNDTFEEHDPTIEDIFKKDITIDKKNIQLEILDTCSGEELMGIKLKEQNIKGSDGFIYVFDITNKQVEELHQFIEKVLKEKEKCC